MTANLLEFNLNKHYLCTTANRFQWKVHPYLSHPAISMRSRFDAWKHTSAGRNIGSDRKKTTFTRDPGSDWFTNFNGKLSLEIDPENKSMIREQKTLIQDQKSGFPDDWGKGVQGGLTFRGTYPLSSPQCGMRLYIDWCCYILSKSAALLCGAGTSPLAVTIKIGLDSIWLSYKWAEMRGK